MVACADLVEADAQGRFDEQADEIGARRSMHVQQRVELASGECAADGRVAAETFRLVEHDELHAFESAQQRVFRLTDDPREMRARPLALDRANHGHGVARVADGRKANDAERCGRLAEGQWHRVVGARSFVRCGAAMVHDRCREPVSYGEATRGIACATTTPTYAKPSRV